MSAGIKRFLLADSLLSFGYAGGMFIYFCAGLWYYTDLYLLGALLTLLLALPWIFLMALGGGLLLVSRQAGEKFRGWLLAGVIAQFAAAAVCFGLSVWLSTRLTMIFGVMPLLGLIGLIIFLRTLPEQRK